ncbi:hypothetical protein GUITHDRAFT_146421 [Guillardia theta CCMP2712]|uniref:Dynamin-type G domain-containing protein n=1 Tax=Guillardia theta (strain CCMP2712) TaxID=905079 RepID=L1II46_GUITC|nr:hypothetical protein GUITHDRAFT_146421 [Guillardia theta CCMP2712]EKX35490.1 hypothetical protein GUITHDRAFT_146421 [Guillardia theta CCMP2712]|eukprot:XP_005822470.1 hypothetical protein GUITHDRAFT_146421 [Guillardia theta CCMP2712]
MSCVNWFVRECLAAKLNLPWHFLVRLDNLPVIETTFDNWPVASKSHRLTLLDLPGPNESNRSEFREMIKQQLNMSTSVILVVDYTQIGSAAAQEMYEDILQTNEFDPHIMKNRLLVFVNKYDEKDDRGMDEEEVKERVAASMMIEDRDKIVLGSARLACLAMRTLDAAAVDEILQETFHEQDLVFDDEASKEVKVKEVIVALNGKATLLYDEVQQANKTFAEGLNERLESHRTMMQFLAKDMKISLDAYAKLAERQREQLQSPASAEGKESTEGFESTLHTLTTTLTRRLEAHQTRKEDYEKDAQQAREMLSAMRDITVRAKEAISISIDDDPDDL